MERVSSIYKSAAGRDRIVAIYEEVLARWPAPGEQKCLDTRHGRTFVIVAGDRQAPPLILLHGSGSNSATWAGDAARYARHACVYAVDIPGESGKSEEARFACRGGAFREWLDDVLDGLGVETAALGGMSLGAWAALDYAVYRPERVSALVLLCPSGICPPRLAFPLAALACAPFGSAGMRHMERLIFRDADPGPEAREFFDLVAKHFAYRQETPPVFGDEELRRVTMPVLYIGGEQDVVLQSRASAARLERLLPAVTACVLPGAGHALIAAGPIVEEFLERQLAGQVR